MISKNYFTVRIFTLVLGLSGLTALSTAALWNFSTSKSQTSFKEESAIERSMPAPDALAKRQEQLAETYGNLPLNFEANTGQTGSEVDLLARGAGYSLFLKPDQTVFVFNKPVSDAWENGAVPSPQSAENTPLTGKASKTRTAVLRMNLLGANPEAQPEGTDEQAGKVNYFTGGDAANWQTGVSTFERVNYRQIYPGIDVIYYGNQRRLEYDFVVAPQSDYRQIKLKLDGAEKVEIEESSGELRLQTALGEVRQHKPVIYQEIDGERKEVAGNYVRRAGYDEIGFEIGEYDRDRELVIDPIISYSTFLSGSGSDRISSITVDSAGNAYVTGTTGSFDLPLVNPFQNVCRCGQPQFGIFRTDAFVTKINAAGTAIVYSTYLGGTAIDGGSGIAVDSAGDVYVTGFTSSPSDFPTVNPIQRAHGGGFNDGYVAKIADSGNGTPIRRNPIAANYDGDCRADLAVFRPNPDPDFSDFQILKSSDNALLGYSWGLPDDRLAPADYDGDGRADTTVFRGDTWYLNRSLSGIAGQTVRIERRHARPERLFQSIS